MASEVSPLAQVHRAYSRLTHAELVLFLRVRNLPIIGTDHELAARLSNHDLHTYPHFPTVLPRSGSPGLSPTRSARPSATPDLPVEIMIDIMDHLGDWELTKAVGIPTSLPQPMDWMNATPADHSVLTGHLPAIRKACPSSDNPLTKVGAAAVVRFGYVNVLEYFLSQHHKMFLDAFDGDLIPIKASRHGRLNVLSWWKHGFEQHPDLVPAPRKGSIGEAVDRASRNGQVDSLDWWANCGLPFEYTEAALEYASSKNQTAVLDWFKQQHKTQGLPLKIGRVMDMASTAGHVEVLEWWARSGLEPKYDRHALQHASCHGKVQVLQWWLGSGLPLAFDQEALIGATRHNRPEILEWWDKSGLTINYRMCDIEEALEESIIPGNAARLWWQRKGVDFNANDKEWMKLQSLN
jgi:hypothetical protein